jgi:hypothetical protein
MQNGTWVCFDCRVARRLPSERHVYAWRIGALDASVACARCHAPMRFIGSAFGLPPNREPRTWASFRRAVSDYHAHAVDARARTLILRRQAIAQRIRDLRGRPTSAGRDELIGELREFLRSGRYAEMQHPFERSSGRGSA